MSSLPTSSDCQQLPWSGRPFLSALDSEQDGEKRQHLLQAFRSFAETAGSLERFYASLQDEVAHLRRELEKSHAGLAQSLEENRAMGQHLDRILECLPCGVIAVSSEGTITRLNPEARRLLCRGGTDTLPVPRTADDLGWEWRELLDPAFSGVRERQVCVATSREQWVAARRAALNEDGAAEVGAAAKDGVASVFILEDVSERKRLEHEDDRRRREQALAEMSALLAHEVRNPLGSLELFASLLAEADLGSECQDWIGHLQHGLRTLAATVNNILHFHGAPIPERAPVDLGQILDWAAGFLGPLARRAGVEVSLHNSLRGQVFQADRHQLEQVLLNLSLNALRAMPDGGRLSLAGRLSLGDGQTPGHGNCAMVTVSDTGAGIAAENLREIFKAGFSTRSGSPGLGLAVCREIIEKHGGFIAANSRTGAGASFEVGFPVAARQTQKPESIMNRRYL